MLLYPIEMFCYICHDPIVCECKKRLKEEGVEFMDLVCATTNGYPRVSLIPCSIDVFESHICSQPCQDESIKRLRERYSTPRE